jgi:hypothetical protein
MQHIAWMILLGFLHHKIAFSSTTPAFASTVNVYIGTNACADRKVCVSAPTWPVFCPPHFDACGFWRLDSADAVRTGGVNITEHNLCPWQYNITVQHGRVCASSGPINRDWKGHLSIPCTVLDCSQPLQPGITAPLESSSSAIQGSSDICRQSVKKYTEFSSVLARDIGICCLILSCCCSYHLCTAHRHKSIVPSISRRSDFHEFAAEPHPLIDMEGLDTSSLASAERHLLVAKSPPQWTMTISKMSEDRPRTISKLYSCDFRKIMSWVQCLFIAVLCMVFFATQRNYDASSGDDDGHSRASRLRQQACAIRYPLQRGLKLYQSFAG